VTRRTGWSILVTALQGHAVNAFFELERCLPVASGAIDPPKLFFVRQGGNVAVAFGACQGVVGGIDQFLSVKANRLFPAPYRFPVSWALMAGDAGRIFDGCRERPGKGEEGETEGQNRRR
jgi:hypothetical protein